MKEEENNTIQIRCYECNSFRTQLILIEENSEEFLIYVICLSCGLYQLLGLPKIHNINFQYKSKPVDKIKQDEKKKIKTNYTG